MGADGKSDLREPPLPPPPMAAEAGLEPEEVRLPWLTPVAMLGAGLLPGAIGILAASPWPVDETEWAWPSTMAALLAAQLGLGAMLGDRFSPRWRRCWRWTIGMAAAAAVPLGPGITVLGAWHWWPAEAVRYVGHSAAYGALFGLLAGLAGERPAGLYWKLPAVALLAGLAHPFAAIVLPGPLGMTDTKFTAVWVASGPLTGLTLACGYHAAMRQREARGE